MKKIDCFCVGGGGGVTWYDASYFGVGGSSSIGSICSSEGGLVGAHKYTSELRGGGDGGSGGGGGIGGTRGGNGGSDGGDGESTGFMRDGGKGQGITTRYFGESNGTLYAGGGGGGVCAGSDGSGGIGGAGGGGNGANYIFNATPKEDRSNSGGATGTGGGAGGWGWYSSNGGGGGYTSTVKGVSVTPGSSIPITVGSGGVTINGEPDATGGSGICIIRWGKQ